MSREIRRVPKDWSHPKTSDGKFVGLFDGADNYDNDLSEWMEGYQMWGSGVCEVYGKSEKWEPIDDKYKNMRYSDYAGGMPSPDDRMPAWEEHEKTHIMMYETCSEGTPISPAFETPEELAHWLADNNASAFGSQTATYEQWLSTCKSGWAPSAVMRGGKIKSGVAALLDIQQELK